MNDPCVTCCLEEINLAEGEYLASYVYQSATHSGDWLGIPTCFKQVQVRDMDFWRVEGEKLVENWVMIDILGFLEQLEYDVEKNFQFVGSKPPDFIFTGEGISLEENNKQGV